MHLPLDVAGEIRAVVADDTVVVSAREKTITVDVPNLRVGLVAWKGGRASLRGAGGRKRRAATISRASAALRLTDLNVQLRLAGGTMAVLGADARPGPLSRLLGVAPLEIRLLSALVSVARALWRWRPVSR